MVLRRLLVLGVLVASPGCGGGPRDTAPDPALARSEAAQSAFFSVRTQWMATPPAARPGLERSLRAFLAAYPADPRARVVRVWLAWTLLERGDLAAARAQARAVGGGRPGAVRDLAHIAEAAILVRQGRPELALALLRPLDGKVVDRDHRQLFHEELVAAELGAGHPDRAVQAMVRWLATAPASDQDAVQRAIEAHLAALPPEELEAPWGALLAEGDHPDPDESRRAAVAWVARALSERLVQRALEAPDPALARRLLERGPAGVRAGEHGVALSRVAASARRTERISGRALGLIVATATPELQRWSAQVVAGVARGLDLPRSAERAGAARLHVRDDDGSAEGATAALAGLLADGVSLVVAGVGGAHAGALATLAEAQGVPLVLLGEGAAPGAYVFDASAASSEPAAALAALAPGAVTVGPGGVPCRADQRLAGAPLFPVGAWKRERLRAVVVTGDGACARALSRALLGERLTPTVGLGLLAAELVADWPPALPVRAVGSGAFPRTEAGDDTRARTWTERHGEAPTWHHALGHDVATLAAAALGALPDRAETGTAAVRALRTQARDALQGARTPLWTSAATGFVGGRLARRWFVVEAALPPGGAR